MSIIYGVSSLCAYMYTTRLRLHRVSCNTYSSPNYWIVIVVYQAILNFSRACERITHSEHVGIFLIFFSPSGWLTLSANTAIPLQSIPSITSTTYSSCSTGYLFLENFKILISNGMGMASVLLIWCLHVNLHLSEIFYSCSFSDIVA